LPEIYKASTTRESRIKELLIVSGGGLCRVEGQGNITEQNIEQNFEGTLFSWIFEKEAS